MDITDLNPNYSFSSFVVGSNNKVAYHASMSVAKLGGGKYNPLFLYGDTGLGKTHLMHSIARYILENNPKIKVLYITSEEFINDVIDAIRSGTFPILGEKYRYPNILLIDDMQYIIGKERAQKAFLRIFNEFHDTGKQIVLSADRLPKDMRLLDKRTCSLFEEGLMIHVQRPDFDSRVAILQKAGHHINKDVIEYIAMNESDIRAMKGLLHTVIALSEIEQTFPNLEMAQRVLKNRISQSALDEHIVHFIHCIVAAYYHCTIAELHTSSRNALTARSRKLFIGRIVEVMLFRRFTMLTYVEIAPITGFSNGGMLARLMCDIREFIQEKCMPVYLQLSDMFLEEWSRRDLNLD